jgi:hypothetical protein
MADTDSALTIDASINLVDFDEVKDLIGWKPSSTINDDLLIRTINAVNELVHDYTQRQFVKEAAPAMRHYLLDHDDVDERSVMIDDLSELDAIALKLRDGTLIEDVDLSMVEPKTLTWRPGWPFVELEFIPGFATSTRLRAGSKLEVTGTWGWDAVPADVRYWAMQTIAAWSTKDLSKFSASYRLDAQRIEVPRLLPDTVKAGLSLFRRRTVGRG